MKLREVSAWTIHGTGRLTLALGKYSSPMDSFRNVGFLDDGGITFDAFQTLLVW